MSDRRRINGPASGTIPLVFTQKSDATTRPRRLRKPNELRRMFLRTGLVPAANGSAYLELESPSTSHRNFVPTASTIKLSCSVHGPKPLSRNASFSPNLQLTASIKFAPFASRQRRGYIRDSTERDLGSHLENALKGVIIPDRWPKSAIEIAVVVLEGEEDCLWAQERGEGSGIGGVGLMNVLAGSITVAAAALADAGIDCLDLLSGGVVGVVTQDGKDGVAVLDPCPSEHEDISSACVVAYLPSRDEITEVWSKVGSSSSGDSLADLDKLIDDAVRASRGAHTVLAEAVKKSMELKYQTKLMKGVAVTDDVEMKS